MIIFKNKFSHYQNNPIKFSPADSEIILKIEKAPNFIFTNIIDKGPGILENEIPMVFKEFHVGNIQLTDIKKGTGLGIPISKKIIEAYNGILGFENEVGKATRFYFTLPI